ncbi:homoserine dehydrogenase [Clostridiaceae bacterium M8S5]|nr:homoserine dehydrogenase [Clostridiaceae bacterium M8S5]
MKKIGLLGFGTVGCGVYEIITQNSNYLNNKVEISKILVRDINKSRNINFPKEILTDNADDIINDPDIDIIIAVIGGIHPSYTYIIKALNNGKHVVTANKAVVSKYYNVLLKTAHENKVAFLFEASVGGGIPVIKPLKQNVKINDIGKIKGILNGTSNFILTKMSEESYTFADALALAQKLGYAEADPTDDIEGYDIARKLSILSNIAFKTTTNLQDIKCRGISNITKLDIEKFNHFGKKVKLIGSAIKSGSNYCASVEPILVDKTSPLSAVNDAFNIVSVSCSTVGELQFYGQGAGKKPTANAVVCDIIDILHDDFDNPICFDENLIKSEGMKLFRGKYYIRINTDSNFDIGEITRLFEESNIKINVEKEKDTLFIFTGLVSAEKIDNIMSSIKVRNFCYARLDDNKVIA